MSPLSFARHEFPPAIIRHAIWLYLRFTLSDRDVEELLAVQDVETSYETVRRWVVKFGPAIAGNLRRLRPKTQPALVSGRYDDQEIQRFKSSGSAQRFVSVHAALHNTLNFQRHLVSRRTLRTFRAQAVADWQAATAAA